MAEMGERLIADAPGAAFAERHVDAAGLRIRYQGPPLVHLHGAGGPPLYDAAHAIGAGRPEAFTSLMSDFLERHARFVVNRTSGLLHP